METNKKIPENVYEFEFVDGDFEQFFSKYKPVYRY